MKTIIASVQGEIYWIFPSIMHLSKIISIASYQGEICLWWGLFVVSASIAQGAQWTGSVLLQHPSFSSSLSSWRPPSVPIRTSGNSYFLKRKSPQGSQSSLHFCHPAFPQWDSTSGGKGKTLLLWMSGALFQEQNKQRSKQRVKNKQRVNNNKTNPPQADNKFRNDPSYIEFKQRTSPLLLLPPPLYKAIPNLIQVTRSPILYRWLLLRIFSPSTSSTLFSVSAAVSFPSTTSSVRRGENWPKTIWRRGRWIDLVGNLIYNLFFEGDCQSTLRDGPVLKVISIEYKLNSS